MTPDQFIKPALGEPATNPARFVNFSAAEFAERWAFKPVTDIGKARAQCSEAEVRLIRNLASIGKNRNATSVALPHLRAALEQLSAWNGEARQLGTAIDDRDAQLTLEFLQFHDLKEWPS